MLSSPVTKSKDSLLTEIREAFDYDLNEWSAIRTEGKEDMRYVSGDPWDPKERAEREKAGRVCLTVDELNQYFNQVINGVRANPRAVKFSPNGDGATDKSAELYADKMREIEYRSKAQIAYTTAFENAVQRGYGFCRVTAKFATTPGQRFNQDLWIEAIPNPDLVLVDADAQRPDSSDMLRCTVYEDWPMAQFKRQFGAKAKTVNFTADHIKQASRFIRQASLILAEHWKVKTRDRKLLLVQPAPPMAPGVLGLRAGPPPKPIDVWEDEFLKTRQIGDTVIQDRMAEDRTVCKYLTNGIEVLEEQDWPGRYIPIVSCYGKVLYVDQGMGAKRIILSMTRLARDPYMLYCYYRTTQCELVGMTPKTPYMAYKGQLDKEQLNAIAKSLHEPVPVILANATTEGTGQTVLPLPVRQPYRPEIELLEIGAEGARRAIQSAMATNFLPTQAQRRNEKSGKALEKMDESANRGSFHFNDHYDDMITHVGVIVEDVMDQFYDSDREIGIRKRDDTAEVIRINGPEVPGQPAGPNMQGSHQVTVSTGPEFNSTREAESEFADALLNTPFAPLIADLAVKLKGGGPVLDEIADRLTPPQFRKPKPGEGPDPQQLMQAVGQAKQENAHLKQLLSQISLDLKTKKLDIQSKVDIALAMIRSKEKIAGLQAMAGIKEAEIKAGVDESIADLEAQIAQAEALLDHQGDELDRRHDVGMAAQDHEHNLLQGQQAQDHTLEQGDAGHAQQLEQQKQAADLAPEPAAPQ